MVDFCWFCGQMPAALEGAKSNHFRKRQFSLNIDETHHLQSPALEFNLDLLCELTGLLKERIQGLSRDNALC